MKLKHYILFLCLFAVIATKTYVSIYTFFSDTDIELSNELDEEDTDDEEDTEKETTEKDIYLSTFFTNSTEQKTNITPNKTIHYYKTQHYLTPNLDRFFSPPDVLSLS